MTTKKKNLTRGLGFVPTEGPVCGRCQHGEEHPFRAHAHERGAYCACYCAQPGAKPDPIPRGGAKKRAALDRKRGSKASVKPATGSGPRTRRRSKEEKVRGRS